MAITSLGSNAQPQGGTTATQSVTPPAVPAGIESLVATEQPVIAQFREQSTPQQVDLSNDTFTNNNPTDSIRIASVGLGYMLESEHVATINLDNTAGAAQVVTVSPFFPYNLLGLTGVQINGGATVYNADGLSTLAVMGRSKRSTWLPSTLGGFGPALSPGLVRVSVANGTVTNSTGFTLSGIASISIATATTCTVTVTFYTYEKLALDSLSLIGALPLQNNSTYAILQRTLAALLGGTAKFPFYVSGGVPGTLTGTVSDVVSTTYDFWSVPSDPSLYAEMVQNSYQVQEVQNQAVSATGVQALIYNIPQNQFLVAAHIFAWDGSAANLPLAFGDLPNIHLQYNAGSVVPVTKHAGRNRARQFLDYGDDRAGLAGYYFWDGEDTAESITETDNAGWVDAYAAALPQLTADVLAGVSVPITFNLVRESVVAGAVQVVGG